MPSRFHAAILAALLPSSITLAVLPHPQSTPYRLVEGGSEVQSASAQIVEMRGTFKGGPLIEIWAGQEVRFTPGFRAENSNMSFHVGEKTEALGKPGIDSENSPSDFTASIIRENHGVLMRYVLPEARVVSYRVFTPSGRLLISRKIGIRNGEHAEKLSNTGFGKGLYIVQLTAGSQTLVRSFRL